MNEKNVTLIFAESDGREVAIPHTLRVSKRVAEQVREKLRPPIAESTVFELIFAELKDDKISVTSSAVDSDGIREVLQLLDAAKLMFQSEVEG